LSTNAALDEITAQLEKRGYIADRQIAMTLLLSRILDKPILLEGPAGVGKTEIAKVLAAVEDAALIRLQCYEGLDANQAIYEWNYQRQLLHLKMSEQDGRSIAEKEADIFGADFLLERPLLKAITSEKPSVLLIDEVDRSDEEFESFLLEILSDWQLSIPEIGTIKAKRIPRVILTSNRSRELSGALRRRCLYLWIDYPDQEKEIAILRSRLPEIDKRLAEEITAFMGELRQRRLDKVPGIAETLDWATALAGLHIDHLDRETVEATLGVILKDWKDVRETQDSLSELFERVGITYKVI
jgi:MoxR-like ATPase